MIEFAADQEGLILKYSSEMRGNDWIWGELKTHGEATISRVFTLERGDLMNEPRKNQDIDEFEYRFVFAKRDGAYLIEQEYIEQRLVYLDSAVVINKSQPAKSVHEEAHARPCRANHLCLRLLRDGIRSGTARGRVAPGLLSMNSQVLPVCIWLKGCVRSDQN